MSEVIVSAETFAKRAAFDNDRSPQYGGRRESVTYCYRSAAGFKEFPQILSVK